MATLDSLDYALHLPPKPARGALDQDEEWCEIETPGGERRRIRFHDYAEIYNVPGLYERLFAEQLDCESPRVVTELLGDELSAAGLQPETLTALDFGAGNGMVGEQLGELAVGEIVGLDLLPEARDAAQRDRPGIYADYYALDMMRLSPDDRRDLMRHDFDVMTCVAALGFGDIPTLAFSEAFNLIGSPGWIAFNIRDRFVDNGDDASGFNTLITRMFDEGVLEERTRTRYRHRVSVAGEPLEYDAIVAQKHADVPLDWAGG